MILYRFVLRFEMLNELVNTVTHSIFKAHYCSYMHLVEGVCKTKR